MRHLYLLKDVPQPIKDALILTAKSMERRRCNHHVLDEPLSTLECFNSVIDSKNSHTNKNRYVVASQDEDVRRYCRGIKGVPLIFVKRSVMVMEPMAADSVNAREAIEKEKFRSGLKTRSTGTGLGAKRKRDEELDPIVGEGQEAKSIAGNDERAGKKMRKKGPKGPNPLSVKKPKKATVSKEKEEISREGRSDEFPDFSDTEERHAKTRALAVDIIHEPHNETQDREAKRKRKRKHKSKNFERVNATVNSDNKGLQ